MRREASGAGSRVAALAGSLCTFVILGVIFLHPYFVRHLRFPIGFDAPYYVIRANEVSVDGLRRIGAVRSASPLLLAMLAQATRQSALTVVAWFPTILAAVAALGAVGLVRAGLRIRPVWIPVIGVVAWAAFGANAMIALHLDNLLNAALVLPAFAALAAVPAWRKGAFAGTVLLAISGLAHWLFYVLTMVIYLTAALGFLLMEGGRHPVRWFDRDGVPVRLLAPAALSGVFVAGTLIPSPPPLKLGRSDLRRVLEQRFLMRLREPFRYFAFPLAAWGGWVAARDRSQDSSGDDAPGAARRFFVWLMASWTGWTVVGSLLQLAHLPTAGARLFSYFFPVPILAGVSLWWLGRRISQSRQGSVRRVALGATAVIAIVFGFATLAWILHSSVRTWIDRRSARQVAAAGAYVERYALGQPLLFVHDPISVPVNNRWWTITRTFLPPEQLALADQREVSPAEAEAIIRNEDATVNTSEDVVLAVQSFDRHAYSIAASDDPRRVATPGVAILRGPLPPRPLPAPSEPGIPHSTWTLALVSAALVALLFALGGGWAWTLLPADPVIRTCVAPALGIATSILVAFAWDRVGLSLAGSIALVPMALSAVTGWGAGVWLALRRRGRVDTRGVVGSKELQHS